MPITIYEARSILTMNPSRPRATHVAVRDGLVLGAGTLDELGGWGDHTLDRRFADKVLMPGFVEGHSHIMEGTLWRFVYVGYHDRMDPNGKLWPGARSIDAVIERLQQQEPLLTDPAQPLVGWGFDPIYFGSRRCTRPAALCWTAVPDWCAMSSMIYSSAHHAKSVELFKGRLRAGMAVDAIGAETHEKRPLHTW